MFRDLLLWGTRRLSNSLSPRVESEILLSFACNISRECLMRHTLLSTGSVSPIEVEKYKKLIAQRSEGYPVQYLVRTSGFYEHDILVGPGALVPRPETEILVQRVLTELCTTGTLIRSVWDLGTGTGCITLALASRATDIEYLAVDKSNSAIQWAEKNLRHLRNVTIRKADFTVDSDLLALLSEFGSPDVVVANPPYLPQSVMHEKYEPYMALCGGGPEGLDLLRAVARASSIVLANSGLLFLEHLPDQSQSLRVSLEAMGFCDIESFCDLNDRLRFSSAKIIRLD
ncbi:MAG: peptide chain release factor N(5)-glutamine methyltransferase [Tropheryma whipplei]|nr:peptide chain release factor N(5)-glutamine methyltransferase [Tropheryma whipplei]